MAKYKSSLDKLCLLASLIGGGDFDRGLNIRCRDQLEAAPAPCQGRLPQHWSQGRRSLETAAGARKPEISGRQKPVLQVQDAANHLHMASEGLQPQPHGEERTFSSAAEVRSFNPRGSLIVSTLGDRLSQHSDGLPPKSKTGPGGAKEKDSGGPGQQQER